MTASLNQPFSFQGASYNRLTADWRVTLTDPNTDWSTEWRDLAARASDLVRNDPVIAALLNARISGTHGNTGLRFRSLYGSDIAGNLIDTDEDQDIEDPNAPQRRAIDEEIARCSSGTQLDATGMLNRRELEEALDHGAIQYGDYFAVRKFIPGRKGSKLATCWLLIPPYRVQNPHGKTNSAILYEGMGLDPDTASPTGIWIAPAIRQTLISTSGMDGWEFVPWYAADGSRNIIHRVGLRLPGSYRGVSSFAQLMSMAKQTKGVIEAYVVAKRIQACHPIFIEADDPVEAAKKDRNAAVWGPNTTIEPGKIYYVGRQNAVHFPTWSFEGADMKAFLDTLYRNQFACWGMPLCVVLGQMSSGSNQAARSDWMQYYRQCMRWQDDHIQQASSIIDESILRESIARDRIPGLSNDWDEIMRGRYLRPPRSMPEPLKEAQAIQAWLAIGRDYTGAFAESGLEFRDTIFQRSQDDKLITSHDVQIIIPGAAPAAGPSAGEPDADDKEKKDDAGNNAGKENGNKDDDKAGK